jgi:DNA-binding beta-propeller fold protein YncE
MTNPIHPNGAVHVGSGRFRFVVDQGWPKVPAWMYGEAVGVACDSLDWVYVFVRGPVPVLVFDRDGSLRNTWGETAFIRPHGIFIGPDSTAYCADDFGHCIRAFDVEGKSRFVLGTSGCPSATGATSIDYRSIKCSAGPFNYPTNLAMAPSGDLYVSDGYGNARVHRFSDDGRLLQSWGEPGSAPGQFHVPHGIAVAVDGTVYVADRENSRIQLFEPDGTYLTEWPDVARPCQIYIDRDGFLFVAELGFHAGRWPGTGLAEAGAPGGRVSIFDQKGVLQARWGGSGDPCAPGNFFAPHGIWVDGHGDLYVTEVILSGGGRDGLVPASCHTLQKFRRC